MLAFPIRSVNTMYVLCLHQQLSTTDIVVHHFNMRYHVVQESPANAKGMRDSSACMKAHCEQM